MEAYSVIEDTEDAYHIVEGFTGFQVLLPYVTWKSPRFQYKKT